MEKINLYTNEKAVNLELATLAQAKQELVTISKYLTQKGIEINEVSMIEAINKNFNVQVSAFRKIETDKILKIIEQFGETAITDGWEPKVNQKVEAYRKDLADPCPSFTQRDYFKYFKFENGVDVKPEFNKQYFIDKHSIILKDPEKLEFYKKHCEAVNLLNELIGHPDNEFIAMDNLFFFNAETKEFELNIKQYVDILGQQLQEKKDEAARKYNLAERKRYEEMQRKISLNKSL